MLDRHELVEERNGEMVGGRAKFMDKPVVEERNGQMVGGRAKFMHKPVVVHGLYGNRESHLEVSEGRSVEWQRAMKNVAEQAGASSTNIISSVRQVRSAYMR
jgi:hypothetical protein